MRTVGLERQSLFKKRHNSVLPKEIAPVKQSKEFSMDNKQRHLIYTLYRSKYINNTYKMNSTLQSIYKENLHLQKKIDHIRANGSGFIPKSRRNNSSRSRSPNKSQLSSRSTNSNSKFRGPNERKVVNHKRLDSSLNFQFEKKEAQRIDRENFNMAKRMISNPGMITGKDTEFAF